MAKSFLMCMGSNGSLNESLDAFFEVVIILNSPQLVYHGLQGHSSQKVLEEFLFRGSCTKFL